MIITIYNLPISSKGTLSFQIEYIALRGVHIMSFYSIIDPRVKGRTI